MTAEDYLKFLEQARQRFADDLANKDANAQARFVNAILEIRTIENIDLNTLDKIQKKLPEYLEVLAKNTQDLAKAAADKELELRKEQRQKALAALYDEADKIFEASMAGHTPVIRMYASFKALGGLLKALGFDTTEFMTNLDRMIAEEERNLPRKDLTRAEDYNTSVDPTGAIAVVSQGTKDAIKTLQDNFHNIIQAEKDLLAKTKWPLQTQSIPAANSAPASGGTATAASGSSWDVKKLTARLDQFQNNATSTTLPPELKALPRTLTLIDFKELILDIAANDGDNNQDQLSGNGCLTLLENLTERYKRDDPNISNAEAYKKATDVYMYAYRLAI